MTGMTRDEWGDDQTDRDRKIRLEEAAEQNYRQAQADALREAADEWAEGAWADQFMLAGVDDDVAAVQATAAWFRVRADDILRGVL